MKFSTKIKIDFPNLVIKVTRGVSVSENKIHLESIEYLKSEGFVLSLILNTKKKNENKKIIRFKSENELIAMKKRISKFMILAKELKYANESEKKKILNKVQFLEACKDMF